MDCRSDASWKSNLFSAYHDTVNRPTDHPIMDISGASRCCFHGDIQHSMHMGVDSYLAAGVLGELVLNSSWGGNQDQRCARIWPMLQVQLDTMEKPAKLAVLRVSQFLRRCLFASLRGNAMETHYLLLALPGVLAELHDGSRYNKIRLQACQTLTQLHNMFETSGLCLEVAAAEEALRLADRSLLLNDFCFAERWG